MITEQWTLGTKNALGINMASKVRSRLKFLSPHVDEKVFKSLQKRISPRKTSKALESVKEGDETIAVSQQEVSVDGQPLSAQNKEKLVQKKKPKIRVNINEWYRKNTSLLDVESIYQTRPNAKTALVGTQPEPRFIWKEKDWPNGFPDSPEEASTDVVTFLEQKDCYRRLQALGVKNFCVGSIVAVTRSDPLIAKGKVRFVGICIYKSRWQNSLGATFTLRNVIDGEPMEVNFQLFSPLIQSIEVLKHETRGEDALWYLRDYPPSMSTVNEKMKPLPYTKEPLEYVETEETKREVEKWFEQIWRKKKKY